VVEEAVEPREYPEAAAPIKHGVFGMTRMTRAPFGSAPSNVARVTPAAMLIITASLPPSTLAMSAHTDGIMCGLTARIITSLALLQTSALDEVVEMPLAAALSREGWYTSEQMMEEGEAILEEMRPFIRADAIIPAPINPTDNDDDDMVLFFFLLLVACCL